jgi:hypothetical protein
MNMNTENKNELATPIIFGTAIGTLCAPFGPAVAIAGFVVGAGLGFWSDEKEAASVKSQGKAPLERAVKKSICH